MKKQETSRRDWGATSCGAAKLDRSRMGTGRIAAVTATPECAMEHKEQERTVCGESLACTWRVSTPATSSINNTQRHPTMVRAAPNFRSLPVFLNGYAETT